MRKKARSTRRAAAPALADRSGHLLHFGELAADVLVECDGDVP
jgi:hypothetical protein